MSHIYEQLGVRTIINAVGPATRLSDAIMPAEVADAMRSASQFCVDIAELQARASEIIADRFSGAGVRDTEAWEIAMDE